MARKSKAEGDGEGTPPTMNPKCSSCGGPRSATTPRDLTPGSNTSPYLWCPTCDGSTIDLPPDFMDIDRKKWPEA